MLATALVAKYLAVLCCACLLCLLALLYLLMLCDENDGPSAGHALKKKNYIIQPELSKDNGDSRKVALLSASCRPRLRVCPKARYAG